MSSPDDTPSHSSLTTEESHTLDITIGYARLAYYNGDLRRTIRMLADIAQLWGIQGEYRIALSSAFTVSHLAPSFHRDAQGLPLVEAAVDLTNGHLTTMSHILAAKASRLQDHTCHEIESSLKASAPLVERYVHHIHRPDADAAYETWLTMYAATAPNNAHPTREEGFRAATSSALLLWWSTIYTVIPTEPAPE